MSRFEADRPPRRKSRMWVHLHGLTVLAELGREV